MEAQRLHPLSHGRQLHDGALKKNTFNYHSHRSLPLSFTLFPSSLSLPLNVFSLRSSPHLSHLHFTTASYNSAAHCCNTVFLSELHMGVLCANMGTWLWHCGYPKGKQYGRFPPTDEPFLPLKVI